MSQPHDSHSVRRILLPSGRAIEVVRFGPEARPDQGLHRCSECRSPLVQPVAWSETTDGRWELTLHCPNCDRITEGIFDQHQVDALEEHLDQGLTDMLGDLRRLTQANMAQEVERFSRALQSNAILPEDF